jgi:hypothetical protein
MQTIKWRESKQTFYDLFSPKNSGPERLPGLDATVTPEAIQ